MSDGSAPVTIRPARAADAGEIARLLSQLGYRIEAAILAPRLAKVGDGGGDPVLLAVSDGRAVGLIALHWAAMLHLEAPTARITTLVVDDAARGRGVGRQLVEDGARLAREAGCAVIELTTALHREDARRFYEAIGFSASSLRLHQPL